MLASVSFVGLIDTLILLNLPSGSIIDVLRDNRMFLLIKIETPHCLLLYADENILAYCVNVRVCGSAFVKCVSYNRHISPFNLDD